VEVAEDAIAAPNDRPRLALDEDAKGVRVAGKNRGDDASRLGVVDWRSVGPPGIARGVDRSSSWIAGEGRAGCQDRRYATSGNARRSSIILVVLVRRSAGGGEGVA